MAIRRLQGWVLFALVLPWILSACSSSTAYPKVGSCWTLGQSDCNRLQAIATKFPPRDEETEEAVTLGGVRIAQGIVFWVAEDYDFSMVQRISIPDFRDLTSKNANRSRTLPDDLAQHLHTSGIFIAVDRGGSSGSDAVLECAITKSYNRSVAFGGRDGLEFECEVVSNNRKVIATLIATIFGPAQMGLVQGGLVGAPLLNAMNNALDSSMNERIVHTLSLALDMMRKNFKGRFIPTMR